jgi:ornithine cyclodeaminase/alanine dehydrogenase-like protein (mu-crystallin family)
MSHCRVLYLTKADVAAAAVPMERIIGALETAFREHGEGRTEMPPKPGVHPVPGAFLHAMPAYIPALHAVGLKWVAGYPENAARDLPRITGLLILNSEETSLPLAIMDSSWVTAKRTGAATALAAKYLARPESGVVGILGCGVQGRSNLEALRVQFPISKVVAYDSVPGQAERFAAEAAEKWGLAAEVAEEPRQAVAECDIVVTAGDDRERHCTIQKGWLSEGAFASLVDMDVYWSDEALCEVDKFTTDDLGQLESYVRRGYHFQGIPPLHATLGEIVAGKKPGRTDPRERTMACNIGAAIGDVATATLVRQQAVVRGLGTWLPL